MGDVAVAVVSPCLLGVERTTTWSMGGMIKPGCLAACCLVGGWPWLASPLATDEYDWLGRHFLARQ